MFGMYLVGDFVDGFFDGLDLVFYGYCVIWVIFYYYCDDVFLVGFVFMLSCGGDRDRICFLNNEYGCICYLCLI